MIKPTALIVGASSGLGKAIATLFAEKGFSLALVSRDSEDLQALSASLRAEHGAQVIYYDLDLLDPKVHFGNFIKTVNEDLGSIQYSFLTAGGSFSGDEKIPTELAFQNCLRLNFQSISMLMNELLANQKLNKCRSILVVSSIAALVPRSQNNTYSAAKMALENYAKSLRHYVFQSRMAVQIQVIRLGYMDSGFTRGKKLLFPISQREEIAQFIFKNRDKDYGLAVVPKFWSVILFVLRILPWHIYKKLRF